MTHSRLSFILLVAATCSLAAGCKKKDADPKPAAAGSGSAVAAAAPAAPNGCDAGQTLIAGPHICVATPDGYVKPLKQDTAKDATGGSFNINYSSDGTIGGKFVATVNVTYNAASPTPPEWSYFEKEAADYCDAPPTLEDIADGKGKFFSCPSKKLEGHILTKSKTQTAKNLIDCQSQSDNKPAVDTICKTLKQL